MNNLVPLARVTAEINSPAFAKDLPGYTFHAACLLRQKGMGEGADHAPSAVQVGDVVDDTVVECLSGKRQWTEGIPFATFFRDAIRSIIYHRCRGARKRQGASLDEVADLPAPSSGRVRLNEACCELVQVREVLSGDPRTKALLDAIEDGAEKRGQVAEALGWDPEYVSVVRTAAKRRLAAAGVRRNKKKVG